MENKNNNIVISVGRQFGCKGRVVGKIIADRFGFKFYDGDLINRAAEEIGFDPALFEKADEKPVLPRFFESVGHIFMAWADNADENYLSNSRLFEIQSRAIQHISNEGPCVIMGRCSDYVLRNNPNLFSVYFSAPMDFRIECIKERSGITDEDKAREMIEKADKKRAEYYNYYTDKDWGHSSSYDLCMDVTLLGVERTASIVGDIIKEKFGL
ncbi:MAG: cytidylate kinase-like family protein [Bacteroidales bacterium]|nr:cytidylate kinase-like family protein [Candidatus Physcocola equi]